MGRTMGNVPSVPIRGGHWVPEEFIKELEAATRRRLTARKGGRLPKREADERLGTRYTVDEWGNLYAKSACDGTACPVRVTHDSMQPGIIANVRNRLDLSTDPYQYDTSGNLLNDKAGHVFVYDAENRPASVTSDSKTRYFYDGDGERVAKCTGQIGGTVCTSAQLYLFGTNSAPVIETDASGNLRAEYIFFNGKRVAMRKADNSVHYYFADQVGSATVVTNESGNQIEQEIEYHPYGEQVVITDTLGQKYRFTGKERDDESGNDYFLARYYSSTFGRFLTPDWAAVGWRNYCPRPSPTLKSLTTIG